ncbi:MAG: beta-L-arabinofuranosidase domain-containing protein, partial [Acidimicrobiales bacterium]
MTAGPVVPVERQLLAVQPVVDGIVEIVGGFWGSRQRLNREVTIPYGMKMLEESGAIENLRIAAGSSRAEYRLPLFRDSDLYKVLEAIAWERAHGREADQERFFASSVEVIAAAQERDGYVNSYVQVVEEGHRFGDPAMGHELYCAGHLIQASVADTRTSDGPGTLGGIANRFASLLVNVLSSEHADFVPGHPEIETALVELYRTNGDGRFVDLAADLIGRR